MKQSEVHRVAEVGTYQGFHIEEALNGIAVATWRNQPNHKDYTDKIYDKLQTFFGEQPNATPTECYNTLLSIINKAKQAIINNPNLHFIYNSFMGKITSGVPGDN